MILRNFREIERHTSKFIQVSQKAFQNGYSFCCWLNDCDNYKTSATLVRACCSPIVGDEKGGIGHQHLKIVTNIFRHQSRWRFYESIPVL